jgi:hypothetical protein
MSKSVLNLGAERDVQEFGGTVDRDGSAAEMTTTARELFDTLRAQRLEPGSPIRVRASALDRVRAR